MNRLFSASIVALLFLSVTGCGGPGNPSVSNPSVSNPPAGQSPVMVSPIPPAGAGAQIAVEAFEPSSSPPGYQIFLVEAGGSSPRLLAHGSHPAWSPDGSKLAFVGYSGQNRPGIFVLSVDGRLTQLTDSASPTDKPVWSPDGTRIAFQVWGNPACSDCDVPEFIYAMNSDGNQLTYLAGGLEPAWSPDGSRLAFISGWRDPTISIIATNGSSHSIAALGGLSPSPLERPAWSPDGTRIAYVHVSNLGHSEGIAVVDVTSGRVTDLTDNFDLSPSWSPDGTRLAFARGSHYREINVVNADGSGRTRLTFGQRTATDDSQAGWSRDGAKITFVSVSEKSGTARICQINTDGTGAECLMKDVGLGTNGINAVWRP